MLVQRSYPLLQALEMLFTTQDPVRLVPYEEHCGANTLLSAAPCVLDLFVWGIILDSR